MKIKEVLSKNKYYRLEVGKDGKVLGGLFRYANDLIDQIASSYEDTYVNDIMDSIHNLGDDLKVPDVNWNGEDKEVVRCAFTQDTFKKHKDTMDTLQTALEHFGYQLIKKEVQPDEDAIIYEDKDQIVYWDDMANIKPFLESFANNLDKDILDTIKANKTTTNYVREGKCSKTSGFNLLKAYNDPNTKDIKLYLGHLKPSNQEEEHTNTIAHMWIEVDGTTYATNEPKGFDRVVTDTLTIDKSKDLYSQVESFLKPHRLQEALVESNNYGYHAGDLGKSEYYGVQSSGRGTGHFGTGTYFVGNPEKIKGYNDYQYGKGEAPHHIVDFSSYKLYKPSTNQKGYDLHDALKVLDGSYTRWKDKVDDINIVKKYEGRDKYKYDKFTEKELEELVGALNRLDSDEPLNYEYVSNFLIPENFDKYYDELVLADLDTDSAFDDQYKVQEQLHNKVQEWTDWRVLSAVKDVSNIENALYQALEGRVSMARIRQGLSDVVDAQKRYEANRDKKVDSLATVFMKSLGYEGIDTRHLNKDDKEQALSGLDNTTYGSVIYDVKPNTIVESFEGKTFTFPNLEKAIDFYWSDRDVKVEKLPIEQLVKDNDLLNDEDLQSYHQRQWDNKLAKEFSINQDKINNMRMSEVPYAVRHKDGKLELGDGRHRVRALCNDRYKYVVMPVISEGLKEDLELSKEYDSEGNQLTKEQAEFFKNSKVRDNQGRLLVCYHGTDADFDEFKREFMGTNPRFKIQGGGYAGANEGFFFTNDKWYASHLGKNVKKCYLNITNPLTVKDFGWGSAVSQLDRRKGDIYRWVKEKNSDGIIVVENDVELLNPDDINDDTIYGFDSVFVAFEPNQIKAITNTNPTNSDNINEVLEEDCEMKVNTILTEGKQDIENFKKWIENNEDSLAPYMSEGNRKAFVNNWVDTFNEERKNVKAPYNDYYYWIKQNNWSEFTKFMKGQQDKKDAKQREKDGAQLVYSDDNWKVYKITTYEASKKYGANTKWCISGSKRWNNGGNGMGFWDTYTSEGVEFYFFINKDTKYALALYPDHKTFEIFDAQDNAISFIPNAPVINEIKVDYFTRDDNRLLMNYIKTGQLPRVCELLTDYLWDNDYDISIYDKSGFDDFLHQIKENVNADWVLWMAVEEGILTEVEYAEATGNDYREDYWGGDTTMYMESDLSFYNGYATLDDALTKDNPAFDYNNSEYFISNVYDGKLKVCKDWVGVWMHINEYIDDDLLEYAREWARDNNMVDEYEELGLSRAYLLDESLQENLREDKDVVEFLYHGSPSPTLNLERDSTLWLAEDYGYAIGYGPYLHICSAHIPNILEVGDTDGYIRGLIPTQFSPKFTEIAKKLNMQPKELLRACGEDCKNIYSLIRTKQFRKICMDKGYDAVETEEFGNICYGVFNRHNVELIDTEDKEDDPTPMNESKLVDTKCDIEVNPIIREELLKH